MSRRYQTARCVLFRERPAHRAPGEFEYLLAMHGSMWGRRIKRWGLPGGRIEWREDPVAAALRELREELHVEIAAAREIGDFRYKRRWHKVVCAPWQEDIRRFDKLELLKLDWFTLPEVLELERDGRLHAGYEREAIEQLAGSTDG